MAWAVIVRVPRSAEADVVKYKFFRNGVLDGEVAQPPVGGPMYTYAVPEDGSYNLTATSVDSANRESLPSEVLVVTLDHVSPDAPGKLILVSSTWTP